MSEQRILRLSNDAMVDCSSASVGDCQPQFTYLFADSIKLWRDVRLFIDADAFSIALIVPSRQAPTFHNREDPDVGMAVVSGELLRALFAHETPLRDLSPFSFVEASLQQSTLAVKLRVYIADQPRTEYRDGDAATVVIPHWGGADDLIRCVKYLAEFQGNPALNIAIGLDNWDGTVPNLPCSRGNNYRVWVSKRRIGPYPIRNHLVANASTDLILFQDSDDLSLVGRRDSLSAKLRRGSHDLVGSQELRVDTVKRRLYTVKYPLDVNSAMANDPFHSVLICTCAMRRRAFLAAGGFSDDELHSLDSEFVYRLVLNGVKIANVDDFLYLRVIHERSLTQMPDTGFGSARRSQLSLQWQEDFRDVRRGRIRVDESSLRLRRNSEVVIEELQL